jgi:hypothetical protein
MRNNLIASAAFIAVTGPAMASTVAVPEPSVLGIMAAGIVGLVVAFRLKNRK